MPAAQERSRPSADHDNRTDHQHKPCKRPRSRSYERIGGGFAPPSPEEIAAADERGRPKRSGSEIQRRKPRPADAAHTKRHRSKIPYPVNEAEGQDEECSPPLHPQEGTV